MSIRTARRGAFAATRRRTVAAPTALVVDNFNRTSTTSPGVAQTGQPWVVSQGTWGTDGNLYSVTMVDNDLVTLDTGTITQDVSVTLVAGIAPNLYPQLLLRFDGGSYYVVCPQPDGAVNLTGNGINEFAFPNMTNGQVLRASAVEEGNATRLKVSVNGSEVLSVLDTATERYTGTSIGFRHAAAATGPIKWDNLTVNP